MGNEADFEKILAAATVQRECNAAAHNSRWQTEGGNLKITRTKVMSRKVPKLVR